MKEPCSLTLVVLAGGRSSRLGLDKAFEKIGQMTLLGRVISSLSKLNYPILIVTSNEQKPRIAAEFPSYDMVTDLFPGTGALGAVYTGLNMARTNHIFAAACDMPFLNVQLINYLISIKADYDAVVPQLNELPEPLHSIYSVKCLKPILTLIDDKQLGIGQLFNMVNTRYVHKDEIATFDPELISFFNINSDADLIKAQQVFDIM